MGNFVGVNSTSTGTAASVVASSKTRGKAVARAMGPMLHNDKNTPPSRKSGGQPKCLVCEKDI